MRSSGSRSGGRSGPKILLGVSREPVPSRTASAARRPARLHRRDDPIALASQAGLRGARAELKAATLPIVSVDGEWTTAAGLLALMTVDGVGPAKALAVARGEQPADALADWTMLVEERERANAQMSTWAAEGVLTLGFFDEAFPAVLRAIPSPPAVLYWRGHPEAWSRPALAVVGTREPTAFGVTVTRTLTQAAASRGLVIVSGLAPGIDTVAHEAALDVGARTVAVLGSGLDTASTSTYGQAALARRIVTAGGALISEQPFGVSPSARTLVARTGCRPAWPTPSSSARAGFRAAHCTPCAAPPNKAGRCTARSHTSPRRRAPDCACCSTSPPGGSPTPCRPGGTPAAWRPGSATGHTRDLSTPRAPRRG